MRENLLTKEQTTCARAVAILCVVCCHVMNNYTRIATPLGGIGVSIFLMLSGYGLAVSVDEKGLKDYWKKRIISVWLPYAIIELAILLLWGNIPLKKCILDFTLINPSFSLGWYLNYIFICYIYFFVVEKIVKKKNVKTVIYFCISLLLLAYCFVKSDGLRYEQSFSFFLGIVAARYDVSKYVRKRVAYFCIILGVVILLTKQIPSIRNVQFLYDTFNLFLKELIAVGIIELVILYWNSFKSGNIFEKFLCFIGKRSYCLYLIHGYSLVLFERLTGMSSILIVAIFISVSFAGAIIYYQVITGIQKIINSVLKKITTLNR